MTTIFAFGPITISLFVSELRLLRVPESTGITGKYRKLPESIKKYQNIPESTREYQNLPEITIKYKYRV